MSEIPTQYTVTPWRTRSELLKVRDELFPPDGSRPAQSSIDLISAWKLRGNLPHAVESTGLLMQAKALEAAQVNRPPSDDLAVPSVLGVRALYTVALTRFVTGYADIGRHKSGPRQSMLEVARSVGLPVEFVELRHEATHGEMPNIVRLKALVDEALDWLWRTYWSKLQAVTQAELNMNAQGGLGTNESEEAVANGGEVHLPASTPAEVREDLKAVLKKYRRSAKAYMKRGQPLDQTLVAPYAESLATRIEDSKSGSNILAEILCTPGYMIPSEAGISDPSRQMTIAFELFDPIISTLALSARTFMRSLIRQIIIDAARHSDKDITAANGLLSWARKFFTAPNWRELIGERHSGLVLYYCRTVLEFADIPLEARLRAPVDELLATEYVEHNAWWEAASR